MKKSVGIFFILMAIALVVAYAVWSLPCSCKKAVAPPVSPGPALLDGLMTIDDARAIVLGILEADEERDMIEAFLYPEVIMPGTRIASWDEDSKEVTAGLPMWFAWIDREPGNIFFAHDTEFIYINPSSGEYYLVAQEYWPVINDESFEGSEDTKISAAQFEEDPNYKVGFNWPNIDWKKFLGTPAEAHSAGKFMHIL